MKSLNISKEWCINMANLEGDAEIGAGLPSAMDDARAMVLSPDGWPPMRVKRVAEMLLRMGERRTLLENTLEAIRESALDALGGPQT